MRRTTRRSKHRQEQNPNQMIKTLAISLGIVMLWQWMFPPQAPVQPIEQPKATQSTQGSDSASALGGATSGGLISSLTSSELAARASALEPARALVTLSGPTHQVEVNSHGQLGAWEITEAQYRRKVSQDSAEPYLISAPVEPSLSAIKKRNETPEGALAPQVAPFLSPTLQVTINGRAFEASFKVVEGSQSAQGVTLSAQAGGVELTRTFSLNAERYGVDISTKLLNLSGAPAQVKLEGVTRALQDLAESSGSMFSPPLNMLESLCAHSDELEREPLSGLRGKLEDKEPMAFAQARWVGVNNRYFMSALSSTHPIACVQSVEASVAGLQAVPVGLAPISTTAVLFEGVLSANEAHTEQVSVYGGPKKLEALKANEPSLSEAIDFGIFTPICLPMLYMMRTFYEAIPNWGVAIILLTLLVKLLTLPLTIKQYRSMAGMKKIQPEMQKLKEQYQKSDPMRFQQETMALYKKHGVNPLAGCLPMVMMMPIYFALYRTIYSAVELYQASFFGWLQDLSMPDPYLITPVALGFLMLVQARINPSAGMDPAQRRMMTTFMPIMFGGMMLFLPSGLVLYIFVNTILGIIQQVWSQKQSEATA